MANKKKLLFNNFGQDPVAAGSSVKHGGVDIELKTSQNSIIRFHVFRPGASRASTSANDMLLNPKVVDEKVSAAYETTAAIRRVLNSLMTNFVPRNAAISVTKQRIDALTGQSLLIALGKNNGETSPVPAEGAE